MNLRIGSMWRDSAAYIDTSIAQYEKLVGLFEERGDTARFAFVENDSTDDTLDRLLAFTPDVVTVSDNCPYFPSSDFRERWRHLAWVANHTIDQITPDDDVFLYVESDLAWEPEDLVRLVDHLSEVDVCSALNLRANGSYYDIWGSKGIDGRRFSFAPPYHPSLDADGLVEVQSMAGCTAMVAEVARLCRFSPDDCYRGWNRAMRLAGFRVWCDPTIRVIHP